MLCSPWHVGGKSRQCTSQPAEKSVLGCVKGAQRGVFFVSRSFGPNNHSRMDRATDLAVHGPRLSIDHKDGFVGRGDQVGAKDSGAGDGTVRVAPLGCSRIHRSTDARDHLHLAVSQVDKEDVLLGGGAGVQVVVVGGARGEECDVSDLQCRLDVEEEP